MMEHLDRSFALISLNSSERQWRIWHYECTDLPIHMHPVWFMPGQECGFCSQVEKLEKSLGNDQPRESTENWPNYISKHRLFDSLEAMLNAVEADNGGDERRYLPSQLAKSVSFNKKLGTAFFRQGIPPNKELPMNAGGGNFQLLLLDTADSPELTKFDQIVLATLKAAKEMDELLLQAINGFFIRCEVNPGKNLPPSNIKEAYSDLSRLPCMFKLEVWIRKHSQQHAIYAGLIEHLDEQVLQLGLPKKKFRLFNYNPGTVTQSEKSKPIYISHIKR